MGEGPSYKVPLKRRREGKTNYYKRYIYVLSGKPRLVVRYSNKYVLVQIAKATILGDVIIAAAHSRELYKLFGWRAGGKNTPASYLTGLLAAIRAKYMGVEECILDIGLKRPVKGSKVFAVAKAFADVGIKINVDEEIIPGKERINGEIIAKYAEKLYNEDIEKYKRLFSDYLKRGLDPRELPKHFKETLDKIIKYGEKLGIEVKVGE
ncbi:MAG: 50S ribosomal protein L18 [Sulfolobales archaeon]|jgi:large subunit ribosomal protein L18